MIHLARTIVCRVSVVYERSSAFNPPLHITSRSLRVSAASVSSPGTPLLIACIHWVVPGTNSIVIHFTSQRRPQQAREDCGKRGCVVLCVIDIG
ncbi:hypothetical protein E2C01_016984 [Portunus trituberculatus]|uniref:Uncharacterized protein n=1 Tax=Portunus trituberculatus TaxID=210409 RepID=A0A5B7DRZ0_PORTR|nr:hypothetical protein [Portunus trituberculatus]